MAIPNNKSDLKAKQLRASAAKLGRQFQAETDADEAAVQALACLFSAEENLNKYFGRNGLDYDASENPAVLIAHAHTIAALMKIPT